MLLFCPLVNNDERDGVHLNLAEIIEVVFLAR